MRKGLIAALMAAAALVPATAFARDAGQNDKQDRGGWHGRDGGNRGDRGNDGGRAQAQPQARPQPRPQAQRQARPQFQPRNGGGNWQGRQGAQGRPQPAIPQQQAQRNWRGSRTDPRTAQQFDRNRGQQNWRGGNDRNHQWNGNRGNADGNWRGNDHNRWDHNGSGNWNRGWRNDNRYDWNRYRYSNRNAYHLPRYYAPYGWSYGYRSFGIGSILSDILFDQSYWIDDPYDYRLPEAYGPYRWVRYYNDALLVDIETGEVVDSVPGIFW